MTTLPGPSRMAFEEALRHRFPTYLSLDRFLDHFLELHLADFAPPTGMGDVVHLLTSAAISEGWISDLVHAAADQSPHNEVLAQIAALVERISMIDLDAADLTMFDMHDVESEFLTALQLSASTLFAVGTRCNNDRLLEYLPRRLARLAEATDPIPMTLDPARMKPTQVIATIKRYEARLRTQSLVFVVRAERVDDPVLLHDFWGDLRAQLAPPAHHLVILLVVDPTMAVPDGIALLSEPDFKTAYLGEWVNRLGNALGWPPGSPRRRALLRAICAKVDQAGGDDRYWAVYAELENVLHGFRTDTRAAIAALDVA